MELSSKKAEKSKKEKKLEWLDANHFKNDVHKKSP